MSGEKEEVTVCSVTTQKVNISNSLKNKGPRVRTQYFSGTQLCSLPPPAGGCAELVAMRKIAPPRIKYHWKTAQHQVNTLHRQHRSVNTAKTQQNDQNIAKNSQATGDWGLYWFGATSYSGTWVHITTNTLFIISNSEVMIVFPRRHLVQNKTRGTARLLWEMLSRTAHLIMLINN